MRRTSRLTIERSSHWPRGAYWLVSRIVRGPSEDICDRLGLVWLGLGGPAWPTPENEQTASRLTGRRKLTRLGLGSVGRDRLGSDDQDA